MAIALAAAAAQAAEVPAPATPRSVWVVSLTEENDKFTPQNKDRYYTQGLKIAINRGEKITRAGSFPRLGPGKTHGFSQINLIGLGAVAHNYGS